MTPEPASSVGATPPEGEVGVPPEASPTGIEAGQGESGGPDFSSERVAMYAILVLVLVGGSFLLRNDPLWDTNEAVHTMMEAIATVLAFMIGALSLVRFYSRKQATFLFIGTGFIGAGLLDMNHALLTTDWLMSVRVDSPQDLFAWSWTSERVFLSLFLAVSLIGWRQEVKGEETDALNEGGVYGTALILTLLNLFFFEFVPLTRAYFPALPVRRPAEFLPALFFGVALFGFLRKGSWRRDAFEHWLIISLIISVLCHAAFMSLATQRFDAMFDAAHLLKIASYLAILTGLLISVYQTFKREGQVLGALTESNAALAHEVEERARTELAVKETSERLQDFLDDANDLIQSVNPQGRILYANSSWKRVLGYEDEDLDRLNLFEIVHPAHRESLEREFDRVLNGDPPRRFNLEYIASDGRIVILSGSTQALLVGGEPVATQGIFRDVTEQRLAERQLAESRANLGALVENTGDVIWSVNHDRRLITFNSAFALAIEAQTGREPKVGDLPSDIFSEHDVGWYEEMYAHPLAGVRHVAVRSDMVDGQLRSFELYANPIQAFEGVSGAVIFGKDVTPRARAEEALRVAKDEAEAANKAKSDFLASMSHELRTPLNSIIGFTNILAKNKEEKLNEKELGFLNRVLSNGKHLLALINEVLDLAKVEAGRMELIIEEIDLAALCVETVQQLEGQAKAKDGSVELVYDVPDSVELVETDSAKLKQVIINLVGNALKFTHEGSVTVRLDTAPDGRTPVAISVIDTGIGIPEDRLTAIFDAFQQAEAGTSRKYGGTGLGLALSRSISLLMGYDLIVESWVGKGSTFKIVLGERPKRQERADDSGSEVLIDRSRPLAQAGAAQPDGVLSGLSSATKITTPIESVPDMPKTMADFRVLVVDDEKDSRALMVHYLEEFGCQVMTAPGGKEGIAAAEEHRPDLITLDLMMPGMTGWEVLKHLKADTALRHIPVVIVSIVAGEGRGRLLGAVDLVTKPFEREDLLRVLWRNLVRNRGGRVLVVDDEEDQRKLLSTYLESVGLDSATASDGREGLEAVRTEAPDAVILDLNMPEMGGMEFLEELRRDPLHAGLPVFVLTGSEVQEKERKVLQDLASAVIPKDRAPEALGDYLGAIFTLDEG